MEKSLQEDPCYWEVPEQDGYRLKRRHATIKNRRKQPTLPLRRAALCVQDSSISLGNAHTIS